MREKFGSKTSFIMASVGSAVGLGNIFRFPALASSYGLGFIVVYMLFLFLAGIPLLKAELLFGRSGKADTKAALPALVPSAVTCGVILCCYIALSSLLLKNTFLPSAPDRANPFFVVILCAVCLALFGSAERIGKLSTVGVFFAAAVLLATALFRAARNPQSLLAFLRIDTTAFLLPELWLGAAAQCFFSLSVAVWVMPNFGAMTDRAIPLKKCAVTIALADAAVSLAATVIYCTVSTSKDSLLSAFSVYSQSFGGGISTAFFAALLVLCLASVISYIKGLTRPLCAVSHLSQEKLCAIVLVLSGGAAIFLLRFSNLLEKADSHLVPPLTLFAAFCESLLFARYKNPPLFGRFSAFFVPVLLFLIFSYKIFFSPS